MGNSPDEHFIESALQTEFSHNLIAYTARIKERGQLARVLSGIRTVLYLDCASKYPFRKRISIDLSSVGWAHSILRVEYSPQGVRVYSWVVCARRAIGSSQWPFKRYSPANVLCGFTTGAPKMGEESAESKQRNRTNLDVSQCATSNRRPVGCINTAGDQIAYSAPVIAREGNGDAAALRLRRATQRLIDHALISWDQEWALGTTNHSTIYHSRMKCTWNDCPFSICLPHSLVSPSNFVFPSCELSNLANEIPASCNNSVLKLILRTNKHQLGKKSNLNASQLVHYFWCHCSAYRCALISTHTAFHLYLLFPQNFQPDRAHFFA